MKLLPREKRGSRKFGTGLVTEVKKAYFFFVSSHSDWDDNDVRDRPYLAYVGRETARSCCH